MRERDTEFIDLFNIDKLNSKLSTYTKTRILTREVNVLLACKILKAASQRRGKFMFFWHIKY